MSTRVGRCAGTAAAASLLVFFLSPGGATAEAGIAAAPRDEGGCPVAAAAPLAPSAAVDLPAVGGGDLARPPAAPGRRDTDEPLDPRSTGWRADRKNPLPWILIAIGGAVVVAGTIVAIYYWNDRRAHFPDDTLGVRTFRP